MSSPYKILFQIKYFERLSCGYFALKIYQNRSLKISFVKLSILNTCILDNVLKICFIWTLMKPMNKWVPNERTLNIIFKMVSNFFCLEGEVIRLFTCDPFLDTFLCIICTCIQFILFPFCDNLWQNSVKTKIQFLYMYDLSILYWYRPFSRFITTKHWLENDFFTSSCIFFFFTFFFTAMTELCKISCTNWFQIFKKVSALHNFNIY